MTDRDPIRSIDDPVLRTAAMAVRMYAETHPRPTQVTQSQAAEMLGVCVRTVRRYVRAGSLKLNGAGYLPIEDVDALRSSPSAPQRGR